MTSGNSFRIKFRGILIWVVLGILIFVPRVTDLGLFLGHDEEMRNHQSLDSFLAIAEGRLGDVYSSNFGGTNLTWARTGAKVLHFLWLRLRGVDVTLPEMVNYGPEFDPLPGAVFNGLLILAVYWFGRKAFGQPIAIVSTLVLALDPYLLSESRILRTEAAYATFATLAMISLAAYVRNQRRLYLVSSGFWTAWTIATKISGVMLAPIAGLVLLGLMWAMRSMLTTTRARLKHLFIDLLVWAGATIVFTFVLWPTLWVKPLQTFLDLYNFVVDWGLTSRQRLDYFFLGSVVDELPPLYYLLVLLYKTTPLIWLGLGAFFWALWRSRKVKLDSPGVSWADLPFPITSGLVVLLFGFIYSIVMSLATFKTERYMMAAACAFNVVAVVGLVALGQQIYQRWQSMQRNMSAFWVAVLIVFFAGHGLFTLLNHPYYFSYYNPLLGGGRAAAKMVQVGSGEVLDLAVSYLNRKPDVREQTVVCGTNLPRCEYTSVGQKLLKREFLNSVNGGWIGADYVITYVFQTQRGDYPPGVIEYLERHPGPEYVATFQGIEYAKVYPAPHAQYIAASKQTGISTLLGYDLSKQTLAAGESVKMKFYWENDGRIEHDMFIQLVNTDGYVWSETTASWLPGFENLTEQRGAILEGEAELLTPVGIPPGQYYLKMGYKARNGQLIGQFELPSDGDKIEIQWPSVLTSAPSPAHRLDLQVDPALTLAGYEIDARQSIPGELLWLILYWKAVEDVENDYVVNLRLIDASGVEAAYWLGRPVHSSRPTNTWRAGQVVQDLWRLAIPPDISSGQYQLVLVVFDAQTQEEVKQTELTPVHVVRDAEESYRLEIQQVRRSVWNGTTMTKFLRKCAG